VEHSILHVVGDICDTEAHRICTTCDTGLYPLPVFLQTVHPSHGMECWDERTCLLAERIKQFLKANMIYPTETVKSEPTNYVQCLYVFILR